MYEIIKNWDKFVFIIFIYTDSSIKIKILNTEPIRDDKAGGS